MTYRLRAASWEEGKHMLAASKIAVDRSSPVPLYYQVAQQIEQLIESGDLSVGEKLWNEADLAAALGLSRPTVRQAVQQLVQAGLLVRRRGVGTHVTTPPMRRSVQLTSLYDDLRNADRQPRTRVLDLSQVQASLEVATQLRIEPGEDVLRIERVRYAGEDPLALLLNYLPTGLVQLTSEDLETGGLYDSLRRAGLKPATAHQSIGARRATARLATLLDETRGAPLLTMTRTTLDTDGQVLEYGTHVYRASKYTFEMDL
jgi:DNA-binding GntR family transcriptional regulator